jgi:hypothetical protein
MEFEKENTDCNVININNNIGYNKISQSLIKPRNPKPMNIINATTNTTTLLTKSINNTPSLIKKEIINKDESLDDNSISDSVDYLSNLSIEEVLQAFRNDAKSTEKALAKACIADTSECKILPGHFRDYILAFRSPISDKTNAPNLLLSQIKIPVLIKTISNNKNKKTPLTTTSKSKILNILERADSPSAISSPAPIFNIKQPLSTIVSTLSNDIPLVTKCDQIIDQESSVENSCMTRKNLSRTPPQIISTTINDNINKIINNEVDINTSSTTRVNESNISTSNKGSHSPIQLSSPMKVSTLIQNESPILVEESNSNASTSVPFIAKKALSRTPPKPTAVDVTNTGEIIIENISNTSELNNISNSSLVTDKDMIVLDNPDDVDSDTVENIINDISSRFHNPIDIEVKEANTIEELKESNPPHIIDSWTVEELEVASSAIRRVSIEGRRRSLEISSNKLTNKSEGNEEENLISNNNNIETIDFFQKEILRLRNELITKEKEREEEKDLLFQKLGGVEERIANVLLESFKKKEEDLVKVMTISIPLSKIEDEIVLTKESISEIDKSINKLEIRKNDRKIRIKALQDSVQKKVEKSKKLKEKEFKKIYQKDISNTSRDLSKKFFSPSQNPPFKTDSQKIFPSENSQFHVPKAIRQAVSSKVNVPDLIHVSDVDNIEFDDNDNGGNDSCFDLPYEGEAINNISNEIITSKTPLSVIEECKSVKNIISKKPIKEKSHEFSDSKYKSNEKTSYNKYSSNMTFVPLERKISKKKSILIQNMIHNLDNEIDNEINNKISKKMNKGKRKTDINDTKKKKLSVAKKLEMNAELNNNAILDVIDNIEIEVNKINEEINKEELKISNSTSKSIKQHVSSSLTFVPLVKKTKKNKEIAAIILEVEPEVALVEEEITSNKEFSKKKSKKSKELLDEEPIVDELVVVEQPIVVETIKKGSKDLSSKKSTKKSIVVQEEKKCIEIEDFSSLSSSVDNEIEITTKSNINNNKESSKTKSRAPTAYSLFCSETRNKVKELNPKYSMIEIVKQLNKLWKETSVDDRQIWISKKNNIEEYSEEVISTQVENTNEIEKTNKIVKVASLKRSNKSIDSNSEIASENLVSKKNKNEVRKIDKVIVNDDEEIDSDDESDCENLFENYTKSKKDKRNIKAKATRKTRKKSNKIISSPTKESNNDLFTLPLSISPVLALTDDNIDMNVSNNEIALSPIEKKNEKRKIDDDIITKELKNNKTIKNNENFAVPVGKIQKSIDNNDNNISVSSKLNASSNSFHNSSVSSIASVMSLSSKGNKKIVIPKLKKR